VFEASWTKDTRYERDDSTRLTEKLGSMFTHLVFTPTEHDEMRFVGWVQQTRTPFEHRLAYGQPAAAERATSVHLQTEWERRRGADSMVTGFASFSSRRRSTDLQPVTAIVTERLTDGPVPDRLRPRQHGSRLGRAAWTPQKSSRLKVARRY